MINQKHLENCISMSLEVYGKYSKQTSIPSVKDFLEFVETLNDRFEPQRTRQTQQMRTMKKQTIPDFIVPMEQAQMGGSREEVISYLKKLFISQFGLTVYQYGFNACELLETVLNILAYAAWAYTIFVPSDTGVFGLAENQSATIHTVMQEFSDPGYAIMRLLPSLNSRLQELTFGHLYQYVSRLYTDYQITKTEGLSAVAILTKLVFVNANAYEYLYIRPIVCIFAVVHEKCKDRCTSLMRNPTVKKSTKKTRRKHTSKKHKKTRRTAK